MSSRPAGRWSAQPGTRCSTARPRRPARRSRNSRPTRARPAPERTIRSGGWPRRHRSSARTSRRSGPRRKRSIRSPSGCSRRLLTTSDTIRPEKLRTGGNRINLAPLVAAAPTLRTASTRTSTIKTRVDDIDTQGLTDPVRARRRRRTPEDRRPGRNHRPSGPGRRADPADARRGREAAAISWRSRTPRRRAGPGGCWGHTACWRPTRAASRSSISGPTPS